MRLSSIVFASVDDRLSAVKKHPLAKLHLSEVVTIGLLLALKGCSYRAFYRWLQANYVYLSGGLPEQSRLYRLLSNAQPPTLFGASHRLGDH